MPYIFVCRIYHGPDCGGVQQGVLLGEAEASRKVQVAKRDPCHVVNIPLSLAIPAAMA
jgi:hypothetical protein